MARETTKTPAEQYLEVVEYVENALTKVEGVAASLRKVRKALKKVDVARAATGTPPAAPPTA